MKLNIDMQWGHVVQIFRGYFPDNESPLTVSVSVGGFPSRDRNPVGKTASNLYLQDIYTISLTSRMGKGRRKVFRFVFLYLNRKLLNHIKIQFFCRFDEQVPDMFSCKILQVFSFFSSFSLFRTTENWMRLFVAETSQH